MFLFHQFYPIIILALAFCCCAILLYISDNKSSLPRLTSWSILAVVLMVAIGFIAPQNLPVVLYKLSLVVIGGVLGYWLDRGIFPYLRPHTLNECDQSMVQALSTLRRALIVIACVFGLTMGL